MIYPKSIAFISRTLVISSNKYFLYFYTMNETVSLVKLSFHIANAMERLRRSKESFFHCYYFFQSRHEYRRLCQIQQINLILIYIDRYHIIPKLCKTRSGHRANIAAPDYCDYYDIIRASSPARPASLDSALLIPSTVPTASSPLFPLPLKNEQAC
uniref:Uncharacterized protein n=1 Tax=Candidatus Methanophaga sp. ANME-1 ERB7 TaxID=2759913 RepID=A0A7G9Z5E3_9EURY|nr:hypothetical protein DEIOECNE_00027 [Methanosarcinales archaeon ANME-1 ERB7]